jgi:hypothetical protein
MLEMRTSERRDLKTCAQRWYWAQVEGLRPHRDANPLWFGTAVHIALAGYYIPGTKRGVHPVETFNKALDGERSVLVTNDDEEQQYVDARAMGVDMLTHYVEYYGDEPNKDYIAPEWAGSVLMERPAEKRGLFTLPKLRFRYRFTYDGVYRDLATGEIWLDEHKTAASIWDDFLPLDDQAGSYWAIASAKLRKAGILPEGEDIAGIMYNFLRKAVRDDRPWIMVGDTKMYVNKPTKKQDYIDSLLNHFGEDSDPDEMEAWAEDLPKMTMAQMAELAETQGVFVHGGVSATQPPPYFLRAPVYRSRAERATMIERIKDEAMLSHLYRTGSLPITKSPTLMGCRTCPYYKGLCQLDEQGEAMSAEEFKEAAYKVVDPYESYRKSTDG